MKLFKLRKKDKSTKARLGSVDTAHGKFKTPCFLPVGTQGTVKTFAPQELKEIGAEAIISNAYHLYIRPGIDIIKKIGGLHKFMGWDRPIFTDSGGYQVFSLSKLRKITHTGVYFNSYFDGREIYLTPERVMEIQEALGSDIAMCFDECTPHSEDKRFVHDSMKLTIEWSRRAKKKHKRRNQALFGIVQGGKFLDLRKESLEKTVDIGFDGYALGGLSVGEPKDVMYEVVEEITPLMPEDKLRYLMGVGTPLDIFEAVENGIDVFDCVNPTRYGRNGTAFTRSGLLVVRNGKYSEDKKPIDEKCSCYSCRNFSRSYIRHLLNAHEILGPRLVSYHNVYFLIELMRKIRESISKGTFSRLKRDFKNNYDEKVR